LEQQLSDLIPGEALIYERANGVVYARYRDKPEIPRWIIGGDPAAVARAQGKLIDYGAWLDLCELALENPTLTKQLDNLVQTYYIIKDDRKNSN